MGLDLLVDVPCAIVEHCALRFEVRSTVKKQETQNCPGTLVDRPTKLDSLLSKWRFVLAIAPMWEMAEEGNLSTR